jgi:allophanate hydrolase subunit 2
VYIGVRGGVQRLGNVLSVGADPGTPAAEVGAPRRDVRGLVRVWPGPRIDWFVDGSFDQLCGQNWSVVATSSVGARLAGLPLARQVCGELPSEGLLEGAVQVPPDGQPIVMLADHPTTGGYPVIAVVDPRDLSEVAQAAPGTLLRFVKA